jgi:hypothetical protein
MRRKMPRLSPPPPFGPPGVAAVVCAASLACQNAVKAQKFVPLQKSSEEPRRQVACRPAYAVAAISEGEPWRHCGNRAHSKP